MAGLRSGFNRRLVVFSFRNLGGPAEPGSAATQIPLGSASRIAQPQHQPHVLDRGSGGSLAEIVEARDENRLGVLWARKDIQFEPVGLVQRLGLDASALCSRVVE